jgi:hypothetical protein
MLLGEDVTWLHAVGGVCIVSGVAIVVYGRHRDAQREAAQRVATEQQLADEKQKEEQELKSEEQRLQDELYEGGSAEAEGSAAVADVAAEAPADTDPESAVHVPMTPSEYASEAREPESEQRDTALLDSDALIAEHEHEPSVSEV